MKPLPKTQKTRKPRSKRTIRSEQKYPGETAQPRHLVIEIQADTISVRHLGSKTRYTISFARLMQEAMLEQAGQAMPGELFNPK